MKTKWLFPNKYKLLGWLILIPSTLVGVILIATDFEGLSFNTNVFAIFNNDLFSKSMKFGWIDTNITNTVVGVLFIIGAVLVGFSREKKEDEFIASIRYSSLQWAVIVNYAILIFLFLFVWGTSFMYVMIYNMFTVLIIFLIRFNYILYRNSKSVRDEE